MATIRELFALIEDCVDLDPTHYEFTSILLPFKDGKPRIFSANHDRHMDDCMTIGLGNTLSTIKHGRLHTIHCILPRDLATEDIAKYRDTRDMTMYKYNLPEREYNAVLSRIEIDTDRMVEIARYDYVDTGERWQSRKTWARKVYSWFGWDWLKAEAESA